MPLVRLNPNINKVARVAKQENLLRDFDSFFNELSAPFYNRVVNVENSDFPIDLYETEDEVILEMAAAGLKAEDLEIGVEARQLTIRGKIIEEDVKEDKERHYWLKNIARTEFSRSLTLPENVDFEKIEASIEDGILRIEMPKVPEAKVRKIEIKAKAAKKSKKN